MAFYYINSIHNKLIQINFCFQCIAIAKLLYNIREKNNLLYVPTLLVLYRVIDRAIYFPYQSQGIVKKTPNFVGNLLCNVTKCV